MKLIHLADTDAIDKAVEAIHDAPILVQFPTVFVLLAAPTLKGAEQLDDTKIRLDGKNYGTAIGSLSKFVGHADKSQLPDEYSSPAAFRSMTGTFIRLPFHDFNFQSHTIKNGTHQGLLLDGAYNQLFRRIEDSFEPYAPDQIWNQRNYSAPLCTSCNVSGHPDGSIVEFDKALDFAREREIKLFIRSEVKTTELGSSPIFGFTQIKNLPSSEL